MQKTLFLVGLLLVSTQAFIITDCSLLCKYSFFIRKATAEFCGCPGNKDIQTEQTENRSKTTPASIDVYGSTMGMCDYLCSIQQGGAACDCSVSIVPGK